MAVALRHLITLFQSLPQLLCKIQQLRLTVTLNLAKLLLHRFILKSKLDNSRVQFSTPLIQNFIQIPNQLIQVITPIVHQGL